MKWLNTEVCKTSIHRFESGRRLHTLSTKPAFGPVFSCPVAPSVVGAGYVKAEHDRRQLVGSGSDLIGPAVNVAHRLLKNRCSRGSAPGHLSGTYRRGSAAATVLRSLRHRSVMNPSS